MPPFYRYSPSSRLNARKPIRSFRDLGVYQSTKQISVEIMRLVVPRIPEASPIRRDLADCAILIPHLITEAHSRRFEDKPRSMKLLEETLYLCNKAVVFIEQAKDIYGPDSPAAPTNRAGPADRPPDDATPAGGPVSTSGNYVERFVCDEIIKKYFYARQKIFNLYRAWKKFDDPAAARQASNRKTAGGTDAGAKKD